MTKDEALDLALELRELADRFSEGWHDGIKIDASDIMLLSMAASQIEQARSAPVQEPIYQMQMMDGKWIDQAKQSYEYNKANGHTVRIVYTTPPAAQRQWVDLTDEEITALKRNGERYISSQDFARAVLAKSKEKNNG